MAYHVFVAMPFGTKEGINFNRVYSEYIKPALEEAGFEVFRADEERRAGDIRTGMFQELLLADLVVADLTIDNPNAWYELGVRHALRARGVIQIVAESTRERMPFDVYVDRSLRYHLKDGAPDPDHVEADKKALVQFATETITAWHGHKVSPVYHLLKFLKEPDWKSLRVAEAREFWESYEDWARRVEVARKGNRPGDILVLAEEGPSRILRLEAYRTAGKALLSLGQFSFALEQYEAALTIDPHDLTSRTKKGILLGRLKKHDEAKEWLKAVVQEHPDDAETWALLGRVEKEAWVDSWRTRGGKPAQMRKQAAKEASLLRKAIEPYRIGFRLDPSHYYSGINALTLMHLLRHLKGLKNEQVEALNVVETGLRCSVQSALSKNPRDYWARVTLGDLAVLASDSKTVKHAYEEAIAVAEKDWFALDSSRNQLLLLRDLEFRSQPVKAARELFDRALKTLKPPQKRWEPRLVFLFSGHMIDAPGRFTPRFPSEKEPVAAEAIAKKLDELGAGPDDLALCGGACGGDLLFAEACLKRNLPLEIRIPFEEPAFLEKSVAFAGDSWRERYYQVKANPHTQVLVMPEALGPLPKKVSAYSRQNLWQLYTALSWGPAKVRFMCLWNRQGSDGPGGTKHMYEAVRKRSGQVYILDTTKLW